MTNAKRNTKSIIALVVMSLLLVASIVLAATGAWFTDKVAEGSGSVNFGKIDIEYSTAFKFTEDATTVMPGDTLHINGVVTNKEEAAYLAVEISLTGVKEPKAIKKVVALDKKGTFDLATDLGEIKLTGDDYDNTYQGKAIAVSVKICAVQQKNVTLTDMAEAGYDEVVAYVTTNGTVQGPQAQI